MNINEILKLVDELIWAKNGKHLDYLQEAILRGTLQGETYTKIAEKTHMSEGHVRDAGSNLWKILSEVLGENVSKANVRAILDKAQFSNFASAIGRDNLTVNNFNLCPETTQSPTDTQQPQPTPTQLHLDLGDAPEIRSFYGREEELATIARWIIGDRCRLVALLGIGGIGKTTLSIRLIDEIKPHFDYVIYRSLRFSPTLEATLANLLQVFSEKPEISHNTETLLSQFINHLRQYRCLIVLDDVQMLFSSGQLAGHYKSGLENYSLFFKMIAEVFHNSCLMINSWEKPREVAKLEKESNPVRSLVLGSLGDAAKEILRSHKLSDEEMWETLINMYQGNPLWLELTAPMIQELCGGRVSEFLHYDALILSEALQAEFARQFQRLTQQEIKILILLAHENEPVALSHILNTIQLSSSDLLNAMQSLKMRFLLEIKERERVTYFSLDSALIESVKSRYREQITSS